MASSRSVRWKSRSGSLRCSIRPSPPSTAPAPMPRPIWRMRKSFLENSLNESFPRAATTSPVLRLEEAVHPDCKLSYGIVQPGDDVEDGLPVVRPVDQKQRVVTMAGLKRISADRAEGYARTKLVGGELLLCVRGSTGEVSMASPELAGGNVTRGIVPIRYRGRHGAGRVRILSVSVRLSSRSRSRPRPTARLSCRSTSRISGDSVWSCRTSSQERATVERAESLYARSHKLRDAYTRKLSDLASLRQSLLEKAFSGRLA